MHSVKVSKEKKNEPVGFIKMYIYIYIFLKELTYTDVGASQLDEKAQGRQSGRQPGNLDATVYI